jgi:signal transduction histidine kinase/ActR/RegA family two-component response regulator
VGLEGEAYVSLPIVNFNESNISSVNVIKINLHRYVVLLEAESVYQRQQQATQDSNETKLLYQKLQQIKHQLEVANATQSRFISGMSHEFRTPISSILGYSHLIKKKYSPQDDEFHYAKAIESNAQYLLSLIDNVLEHAQLEADKLVVNKAPFLLTDLVGNLEHMFRAQEGNSKVRLVMRVSENLPEAIYSDQIRLQQVLINIIGNAFKFTENGSVSVSFSWEENVLKVIIMDTGPGIPVEHQQTIFQAYNRYNAINKKGAGLGLAISAQIAEKLEGKLELESRVGEGCIFTLKVKAEPADLSAMKNAVLSESNQVNNVLIVEDDADLVELLNVYLHEFGFSTVTAIDGAEALQKCENEDIDLVLLDMQLPLLSGVEVVKKLRELGFNAPVIAMTASSNNEDKLHAMQAGCNEFLSKPIQPSPLMNAINNILNHHV